jgi:hypothetical protein
VAAGRPTLVSSARSARGSSAAITLMVSAARSARAAHRALDWEQRRSWSAGCEVDPEVGGECAGRSGGAGVEDGGVSVHGDADSGQVAQGGHGPVGGVDLVPGALSHACKAIGELIDVVVRTWVGTSPTSGRAHSRTRRRCR